MLWDFPFPSLPRVVKESLFLEKKGGSVAVAKELSPAHVCVCCPDRTGPPTCLPFPCSLTNSISPKSCAKVLARLPLTLDSRKKERIALSMGCKMVSRTLVHV